MSLATQAKGGRLLHNEQLKIPGPPQAGLARVSIMLFSWEKKVSLRQESRYDDLKISGPDGVSLDADA